MERSEAARQSVSAAAHLKETIDALIENLRQRAIRMRGNDWDAGRVLGQLAVAGHAIAMLLTDIEIAGDRIAELEATKS